MTADRHESESAHELRLEGLGLLLGGGFLLALIVGSFFLGRWVERRAHPTPTLTAEAAGPLAQIGAREPDLEAAEGLDFFDTVEGEQKQAEPSREVQKPAPRERKTPAPSTRPAPVVEGGDFYVQVVAVRDQGAAAEVIETLEAKGYGVRLFSEREGQGTLYKVRVGGYATREQAGSARDALRQSGHPGAFVWTTG